MNKLRELIKNPYSIFRFLNHRGLINFVSDRFFVKVMYRAYIGRPLDLNHPKTYNEKLQWIKLNDRKPQYTRNADKFAVREYIEELLGEDYLVPLIGVYENANSIPLDKLPDQFVLKCTHGSGTNVICRDKSKLNWEKTTAQLNKWLGKNAFYFGREWSYKNIKPRIICEELIKTDDGHPPIDYKFMCFNGEPQLIQVHKDRGLPEYSLSYYTLDWVKTDIKRKDAPTTDISIPRPDKLDEMLEIARKLSSDTYYSRVDLYFEKGRIYFGEITYYPTSGFSSFDDEETDLYLGSLISLPID